jgi:FAD:protein FMN transferase
VNVHDAVVFEALGTTVWIEALSAPAIAERAVRSILDAVDLACSRFRSDSELSLVNASSGKRVAIGPLLSAALGAALDAARRTDGIVDPTVGAAVGAIGYDDSFERLPTQRPPTVRIERVPGWRAVELDPEGTVVVPAGVRVDLGATAKAMAVDLAAAAAASATCAGVLVSVGGDIAVCGTPPPDGWTVGVADSHRTAFGDADEAVTLWFGGMATSSTTVRRWYSGETDTHHIVDPRTGASARSGWRTVSVAGPSCIEANVLATWAIVCGPTPGLDPAGTPYRAVRDDGTVLRGNGWPEPR